MSNLIRKLCRSKLRGSKPNFFCTSSERSKRMRSASFLNFSLTYFSTCARLMMVRLTFFLMGRRVSWLAKARISSTERNSSCASAGVILCSCSTGSICGVGEDWGVGDDCGVGRVDACDGADRRSVTPGIEYPQEDGGWLCRLF